MFWKSRGDKPAKPVEPVAPVVPPQPEPAGEDDASPRANLAPPAAEARSGGEAVATRAPGSAAAGRDLAVVPATPLVRARTRGGLDPAELRRSVDARSLGFKTTADLVPAFGLVGQERALRAIEFGANMRANDFNIFVLGAPAGGTVEAVRAYLQSRLPEPSPVYDWAYVNNFEDANKPRALRLECGRAPALARAMIAAIDELRATLPAAFEGEDYQARRRAIDEEFRSGNEEALEALNKKANGQNIAILRTPNGFGMAPMYDGKVVKPEVYGTLPEDMRREIEAKIETLQKELEAILERVPKADKQRRAKLAHLNEETAAAIARAALEDAKAEFADVAAVVEYLDAAERDLVRNAALFLPQSEEEAPAVRQPVDTSRDPRFRRYMVNLFVANGPKETCTTPLVEELNPTYGYLVGRIEHIAQMGTMLTDFLLIKPGALHRANGGYLLVDARKLLLSPFAWEGLKRTIRAGQIRIEHPAEGVSMLSTQTLDPEAIPLDVKIVLFGDRQLYYLLAAHDPDFPRLFKVQADFDDAIARTDDNAAALSRVVAGIVAEHKLKPVDAEGVARLIEEGARMADDREKLSIEIERLADIVREAAYWSQRAGRSTISRACITHAIDAHTQRADRLRDLAQESIDRAIVMIDTSGSRVGQINALSALQLGDFRFGRPSRITARVRMGAGRVTDIEREVNLGGPLHSKGVMILWGFLAGRYAQEVPLALAASLVFEQSYGGVDGDSASSTELYALLSALSGVPIGQGLAVTGSVNQWGEVQAIGGVNEKIEGFFDVCKAQGLDGQQGVLIPKANVQHLMLREDVVEAARSGRFTIHAVSTIDEGIEVLTGIAAGERGADGTFPPGTVNALVEGQLVEFAERARRFAKPAGSSGEEVGMDKLNGRAHA